MDFFYVCIYAYITIGAIPSGLITFLSKTYMIDFNEVLSNISLDFICQLIVWLVHIQKHVLG